METRIIVKYCIYIIYLLHNIKMFMLIYCKSVGDVAWIFVRATILAPCHVIESLQLFWTSEPSWWILYWWNTRLSNQMCDSN